MWTLYPTGPHVIDSKSEGTKSEDPLPFEGSTCRSGYFF